MYGKDMVLVNALLIVTTFIWIIRVFQNSIRQAGPYYLLIAGMTCLVDPFNILGRIPFAGDLALFFICKLGLFLICVLLAILYAKYLVFWDKYLGLTEG